MTNDADEDELFYMVREFLNGKPIEAVVPILIVAAARALSLGADGDEAKLGRLLSRFDELLIDQAFEMLREKRDGTGAEVQTGTGQGH